MNPNKSHFVDVNTLPREIDDNEKSAVRRFYLGGRDADGADLSFTWSSDEADKNYRAAIETLNNLRHKLLRAATYLTHEGATYALSSEASPCLPEEVEKRRDSGEILGVPDHGQWLYPAFQFKDNQPSPFMQEAHNRFREITGSEESDRWHTLDFFLGRYHRLGGQTIASCLWDEDRAGDIRFIIKNTRI